MAIGALNANEFKNDLKERYLLKLAPDFGIFDAVEKYFIDKGVDAGFENLFFYKRGKEINFKNSDNPNYIFKNNDENVDEFRRFMVKSDKEITIKKPDGNIVKDNDAAIVRLDKKIDSSYYTIIIDEQGLSGGWLTISTEGSYLIGVCF